MTESSMPWAGTTIGDHGPYTDADWSDMWRKIFSQDRTVEGILAEYANMLEVTGAASPVSINTGAAFVDGKFYENTASVTKALSAAHATLTTIDRIVLRKDWTGAGAQTVRLAVVSGTPGAGAPALTQNSGTRWEISLCQCSIAAVTGAVTILDERRLLRASIAAWTTGGYLIGTESGYTASAWNRVGVGVFDFGTRGDTLLKGRWLLFGQINVKCGTSGGVMNGKLTGNIAGMLTDLTSETQVSIASGAYGTIPIPPTVYDAASYPITDLLPSYYALNSNDTVEAAWIAAIAIG